jgi:acarbose 7IV-phosphotransferase
VGKIVVAGVASLAVHLAVDQFPVGYTPEGQPRWLCSGVGGAGAQIAAVLQALGDEVRLCTVVGGDAAGRLVRQELRAGGLDGPGVIEGPGTSQTVVLVAPDGRRIVFPHQSVVNTVEYPQASFVDALQGANLAVLTNTEFVRSLLAPAALRGVPIAADVNVIADLHDAFYQPWLDVADIIFCSDERLPCPAPKWIARIMVRYPRAAIAAVGCGAAGTVLGLRDGRLVSVSAVAPLGVHNTSGAGDALFAVFLHGWLATGDPLDALGGAVVFAGWRIGHRNATAVLLSEAELAGLRLRHPIRVSNGRWDSSG